MPGGSDERITALDGLVFLCELVMLAVLATAGARLVDGTAASLALAIALPLAAAVVWGLLLAPNAGRRLQSPARLAAKLALVVVSAALLAASGLPWWAAAFLVVAGALVALGERSPQS